MVKLGNYNLRNEEGLSLVELLVVVTIIVILASMALLQPGTANRQFHRQNAAGELKVAFERARFDSVKRRADGTEPYAYVEIFPASFTLRTYKEGAVAVDQTYPFPEGVVAAGYGFSLGSSKRVQFDRRGEATVVGGIELPQFMICNGASCPTQPGNAATTNTVLVTATGTVNLLPGGVAIPTFTDPTVSNPTVVIRDEVVLP